MGVRLHDVQDYLRAEGINLVVCRVVYLHLVKQGCSEGLLRPLGLLRSEVVRCRAVVARV